MRQKTASAVCSRLRDWFIKYGVPDEIASDGGPPFQSYQYTQFLQTWGVKQRTSSAYYPQSNGHAELAVKMAKRILTTNIAMDGSLDTDSAARALLAHRNTPVQDIGQSPAMMLIGHALRDHLPATPHKMRSEWTEIADAREMAMAKRHVRNTTRYNEHTHPLQPLAVGDDVAIQNQDGVNPLRWNRTGIIVEANS